MKGWIGWFGKFFFWCAYFFLIFTIAETISFNLLHPPLDAKLTIDVYGKLYETYYKHEMIKPTLFNVALKEIDGVMRENDKKMITKKIPKKASLAEAMYIFQKEFIRAKVELNFLDKIKQSRFAFMVASSITKHLSDSHTNLFSLDKTIDPPDIFSEAIKLIVLINKRSGPALLYNPLKNGSILLYIPIDTFEDSVMYRRADIIKNLCKAASVSGMIIDLRQCSGGGFEALKSLSSCFLKKKHPTLLFKRQHHYGKPIYK